MYGEVEITVSTEEKHGSCSSISDLWPAKQITNKQNWGAQFYPAYKKELMTYIIDTS